MNNVVNPSLRGEAPVKSRKIVSVQGGRHSAIADLLRVATLLRVVFLVRRGPLWEFM